MIHCRIVSQISWKEELKKKDRDLKRLEDDKKKLMDDIKAHKVVINQLLKIVRNTQAEVETG